MTRVLAFLFSSCGLFGQMVWFEPNRGQVAGKTEWIGRSKGAHLYITGDEVVYANKQNIHMRLVGASKRAAVEGAEPTGGYSSYFTGRDENTWFTGVPHYANLRYKNVYPGIDLLYYASGRNIEYDFELKAGAKPELIELAFSEPVRLDHGDLVVAGLRQHKPRVLQDGHEVAAEYRITQRKGVEIALEHYDPTRGLTIDPVLEFSTFLGGPGDDGAFGVKVDAQGNIFVAGGTQSPASPTLDPFQQTNIVGMAPFLFKLAPDGKRILYYVILGANGYDTAKGLALDTSGSPVVIGNTRSPTFPLKNAFQSVLLAGSGNAFVTKLSPDVRQLVYSSYLGGSIEESANALALDNQANAFIFGETRSRDFPVKSAIQASFAGGTQDCFLTKIAGTGDLIASTYLGGSGGEWCEAAEVESNGALLVAGASSSTDYPLKNSLQTQPSPTGFNTPVLVEISPDLQTIRIATFLGGAAYGDVKSLTTDLAGNVYIGGSAGPNFPITKDALQSTTETGGGSFIAKLDLAGRRITYATYLGGGSTSFVTGLAVDNRGFLYASGSTGAPDFPLKNPFQPWRGGGVNNNDCFLAKLTTSGGLIYSTPLGGSSNEICYGHIAVNQAGDAHTAGVTWSQDFPIRNAYQSNQGGGADAFLVKISDATAALPSPLSPEQKRLSFRYALGGQPPTAQTIVVTGGQFAATANLPWVTTEVRGSILTVSINVSGLAAGNYQAQVTLTPGSGTPTTVDVALAVLGQIAVLSAVEPPLVAIGTDDLTVSIHGSGFMRDAKVLVDGILWTVTPVQFVDTSTLKFVMPKAYFSLQYNHTIAVQNPNSDLSNTLSVAVGVPAPFFSDASVTNAASFATGPVAPGEIITIFGTNLAGSVTFDNIPATIVYTSATQVSATVPYEISGSSTVLKIGVSAPVRLSVQSAAPGIFAAVVGASGILTLYATGCGAVTDDSLPLCKLPVSVTINDRSAEVLYAGVAPGLVRGANQINVRIPEGVSSGPLRITLKAGDISSKEFQSSPTTALSAARCHFQAIGSCTAGALSNRVIYLRALNHLSFAGPNGGQNPLYQTGGPRSIQLALRIAF